MSSYFQKKQQFNCPRDLDGQMVPVLKPGKYSEYDLVRWHSEWRTWRTAENLPPVWVSPAAEVAVKYPDPKDRFRVLCEQWMSSCPIARDVIDDFLRTGRVTAELQSQLRSLRDGYLYVWFPENPFTPNRTSPVQLHRMVAESFVEYNDHCFTYNEQGKVQLRTDLQVDHLDSDRLNNFYTNLVWVPPEVNRAWIGKTVEQKQELLECCHDIYV